MGKGRTRSRSDPADQVACCQIPVRSVVVKRDVRLSPPTTSPGCVVRSNSSGGEPRAASGWPSGCQTMGAHGPSIPMTISADQVVLVVRRFRG